MERLRYRDLRALLSWTRGLHDIEDLDVFPLHALRSIKEVLGVDSTIYAEFSPRWQPLSIASDCPEYAALRSKYHPALEAHLSEHPLVSNYAKAIRRGVSKISDFATQSRFRRLGVYNDYYRPLGVNYQIAFELPAKLKNGKAKGKLCTYVFGRTRGDFSERDRTLLHLMLPYLAYTYRTLSDRARLCQIDSVFKKRFDKAIWMNEEITIPSCALDLFHLTPREREVLEWVAKGKTNREIGIILGVSSRTVQKHLDHLFIKLRVESRMAAAAIAFSMLEIDS